MQPSKPCEREGGRQVWKWVLAPLDNHVSVPPGTRFLYAAAQRDDVVLYGLVPEGSGSRTPEKRHIRVVGTGLDSLPDDDASVIPLGLAALGDGSLMFHVFEIVTPSV